MPAPIAIQAPRSSRSAQRAQKAGQPGGDDDRVVDGPFGRVVEGSGAEPEPVVEGDEDGPGADHDGQEQAQQP